MSKVVMINGERVNLNYISVKEFIEIWSKALKNDTLIVFEGGEGAIHPKHVMMVIE